MAKHFLVELTEFLVLTQEINKTLGSVEMEGIESRLRLRARLLDKLTAVDWQGFFNDAASNGSREEAKSLIRMITILDSKNQDLLAKRMKETSLQLSEIKKEQEAIKKWRQLSKIKRKQIVDFLY
jgi:hypothetical protein